MTLVDPVDADKVPDIGDNGRESVERGKIHDPSCKSSVDGTTLPKNPLWRTSNSSEVERNSPTPSTKVSNTNSNSTVHTNNSRRTSNVGL